MEKIRERKKRARRERKEEKTKSGTCQKRVFFWKMMMPNMMKRAVKATKISNPNQIGKLVKVAVYPIRLLLYKLSVRR